MPRPRWGAVTVDIDGTLTTQHGWRVLSRTRGREAEYEATNRRFFAKEIGEDEHLGNLLGLASGLTISEVEGVLEATPKLDGIAETVAALHSRGLKVALLTHNPSYVCDWYLRRFGFDDAEGTSAAAVVDGVVAPVEGVLADKLGGLQRLAERLAVPAPRIVHVGDGWADSVIFSRVGAGIALNSHLREVREAADVVVDSSDFRSVLEAIDHLKPRRRVKREPAGR